MKTLNVFFPGGLPSVPKAYQDCSSMQQTRPSPDGLAPADWFVWQTAVRLNFSLTNYIEHVALLVSITESKLEKSKTADLFHFKNIVCWG